MSVKEHYGLGSQEYLKSDLSLYVLFFTLSLVPLAGEKELQAEILTPLVSVASPLLTSEGVEFSLLIAQESNSQNISFE